MKKQYNMDLIRLEARKELARRNYIDYCEYVHRGAWKPYPVHKLICDVLETVMYGKSKRIIIQVQPRVGKSNTVTETFPSYYMMKHAQDGVKKSIIQTSYSGDLAEGFGARNRNKVDEFGLELFNIDLSQKQRTKSDWMLTNNAEMVSVGIGGSVTGKGADLMIIDDPIKNRQEAESETYRERLWNEWTSTLRTRLHRDASVILIQTRWHEDDLAGRLIAQGGWEVFSLPAICEEPNDILGRNLGDPLCPELGFDREWAIATKKDVGSRTWESLYQQRPTANEGNIIKREWFKWYNKNTVPQQFDELTQSWDCAFKDTKGSDFVSGGVFGRKGSDHYLLYRVKERLDFIATINAILMASKKYPTANLKLVEDKANGTAVIAMLRKKVHGIVAVTPRESKEARTHAVTPLIEGGNFYIPEDEEWAEDYINELVSFPNAKHDDQVDMTTQYLKRYINPSESIQLDTEMFGSNNDDWLFY